MSGRYLYCRNPSCGVYLNCSGADSCALCGWVAGRDMTEDVLTSNYDRDMKEAECQVELLRLAADQFREERDQLRVEVERLRGALSYLLHVMPVLPPAAKLIVGMQTKYDLAVSHARSVLQAKP